MKMMTPYAAAKFVNNELDKHNIKRIPPQMMYNYTKARINAGKTPFIAFDEKNGVDVKSLEEWTKKYVAKKLAVANVELDDQAKFDMSEAH